MGNPAWPLVGRAPALRLAGAALAGGSGVLITGPLGVGRTRLAEEVLAAAERRGGRVVRLTVTRAAATIPFGAAAPLLPPAGPGATTSGTLLAARQAFAERAGDGVVVVGVDDAHLLDEATATLLAALVEDGHVRLVLTVRSGDHVPEAVATLWQGPGWRHVELAELTEAEVRDLLTRVLDGEVESATVERLREATRGNVLFLRELCRDAVEAGALAPRHGVWTWAPGPFTGPRLHDLVAARIGALTSEEHDVAGLLALGEPLALGLLEWLSDAEVVAGMRERGLVDVERVDGRQVARLSHPLYADGIRAQLGPLETADLYATLVRGTLAEAGTHVAGPPDATHLDPDERLRLAVWSISSNVDAEPDLLAAAAADARDHDDPALAERLARAALGQTPSTGIARPPAPVPPPCVVSFGAALTLGEALGDLQRPDEAEAVLQPLAGIARSDGERTRVAVARLAALRLVAGGTEAAHAVASGAGVTDRTGRDLVRAALADTLSHLGALDEAGRMACELVESGAPAARPRAAAAATIWLALIGRSDRAVDVATGAGAPPDPGPAAPANRLEPGPGPAPDPGATPAGAPEARPKLLPGPAAAPANRLEPGPGPAPGFAPERANGPGLAGPIRPARGNGGVRRRSPAASAIVGLVAGGRVTEAEAAVERAVADPVSRRHLYRGTLLLLRGRIALSRGRPATARSALGEAAVVLGRADQLGRHAWALTLLAEAHALLGDAKEAEASLAARTTWGQSARYHRDSQRAEVWALVATGDVAGAAGRALAWADDCRATGHAGYELTFLDLALRLGADEAAERALALPSPVEGPFAPAFAGFCRALAAGDGPALDDAATHYADMGLDLHAAEAATHAARAHHRAGDQRRAGEARARARGLAERCEGARTPTLAAGSLVGDLTPREREVALLAGQGLSSRAIAERYDVSVRTIDNQLGRAYRKLGVTSRSELAELLGLGG